MTEGSSYPFHSPLVGRERELSDLDDALARAIDRQQLTAVTFVGARGVGKSRLLDEAVARLSRREPHLRVLRASARDSGGSHAYDPIARLLRARAGVAEGAPEADVRSAFAKMIGEVLGGTATAEFLHVLGAYVGVSYPESPLLAAVDDEPVQRAALQHAVVRRFFEIDGRSHPLLLVLEDLERASDDALGLVHSLITSLRGAPVLLVATARPELLVRRPEWSGVSVPGASSATLPGAVPTDHVLYELLPLRAEDAAQLVLHLLDPVGDPPEDLVDAAVDVAGGSPALLEQMVRAYVASGTLQQGEDGAWQVHLDRLDDAQLPLSVEDAIAARIAALAPTERKLLEHAAVMGGVFWLGGLVALGRLEREAPDLWGGAEDLAAHYRDLLEGLRERDYVMALPDSTMAGESELAFKHNLERETLYHLMNAHEVKRLHLHVAEWLEARFPATVGSETGGRNEEQCELLATHFEGGGATRRAGLYWLDAADQARARFANTRAAELYDRGLAFLGIEDEVRQLDALHNLGDVLQLAGKNEEAIHAFQRMRRIAFRLDLKAKGGVAHNRIGRVYRAIGHLDVAMRHLGTGHALFDAAADARGVASSLDDVGKVHWMRGTYDAAERFFQKGLELRRDLGDPRSIALSLNNLGLVYQDSGRFEAARDAFSEAFALRREIGDRAGIAQTLNNLGSIYQDQGDHLRAQEHYREALDHARAVGDRMRQAVILTNLGETMYRQDRPEQAIETLREAEHLSATLGDRILEGEILRGLAKAHLLLHDVGEAKTLIARSIALFEQAKGKAFLAVGLRTAGEIEQAAGWGGGEAHERARQLLDRSIQLLEELGNDVELARSCHALASFLELDPDAATDPIRVHEIQRLRTRAAEIEDRLHGVGHVPEEATDPGATEPASA
ncbi:MAG: tetratricopeptide repeat protein [Sandaracinaceae bacterium]|nr:tetratricopeptide repeat protein [Sandaracinaceae bacterium]